MLKSFAKEVYDFKKVDVPKELLNIQINESEINRELELLVKKNSYLVNTDDYIKPSDTANIKMQSNIPKYNKENVPISVGVGFFDADFENNLLGMREGEEKTVDVKGEPVLITVLSIKRKVLPEITDEFIAKQNMDGIYTVAEYKNHFLEKRKHENLRQAYNIVMSEIIAKSDIVIADEDIETFVEDTMKTHREKAESNGMRLEEMTKDQLKQTFGADSLEKLRETLKNYYTHCLIRMLLEISLAEANEVSFDQEGYEAYAKELSNKQGQSIEDVKKHFTFITYLFNQYEQYYYKNFCEYYQDKFKTAIVSGK